MNNLNKQLAEGYRATCRVGMDTIEEDLLSLNGSGTAIDAEVIDSLFQNIQSVRKGAGLYALSKVAELAQRAESVLDLIRSRKIAPTPDRVGVLLGATDRLRDMLQDAGSGNQADSAEVMFALAQLLTETDPVPRVEISSSGTSGSLRSLIVEDDFASRLLLQTFLSRYGECHLAVNGREAIEAVQASLQEGRKYDLICMDIMMPEVDGREAVRRIRAMEEAHGILWAEGSKIIMTTAVDNLKGVFRCFMELCDAYLVKPIDLGALLEKMKSFQLVR